MNKESYINKDKLSIGAKQLTKGEIQIDKLTDR